jgi:hypothetical protein
VKPVFEREHHRRIAHVLQALDAHLLLTSGCLFGGGTAMALRFGEYRESVDIDFLVSHLEGYRHLRHLLTSIEGINAICKPHTPLKALREVRADQYGLRTLLDVQGAKIKFEIVLEGRITLSEPGPDDHVCGVAALTPLDMCTSKLLANADRWPDASVLSRDLIDLAMMQPSKRLMQAATAKARVAYGDSVQRDLGRAVQQLRERPHRLSECMQKMQMTGISRAALWQRIKAVEPRNTKSPS